MFFNCCSWQRTCLSCVSELTCTSQISQWKVLFWSPVDDSDGELSLAFTPVLGKDLMAPSPLLASSIVLCLVPVQIQSHITGVSKLSTNRRGCRRMQRVRFLTTVVGLQLRGRVDSHLAEGAVEEAYSFLFLRLLLSSNPYISIFLCLSLGWRRGFRGHFHSFSGAAAQRCRLRGRVWGWGFCNKPRIKQSNVTLIRQSTQSSVRAADREGVGDWGSWMMGRQTFSHFYEIPKLLQIL